jgi:anti-anti-sigma regulatory factor
MASAPATLRLHQDDQGLTFQVDGRATSRYAPTVSRLGNLAITASLPAVRFDLRRCTYLDSTFLGTLLLLHRAALANGRTRIILLDPTPACLNILRTMGVTTMFEIASAPEPAGPWADLPEDLVDSQTFANHLLKAHEELCTLGGDVEALFRGVVNQLQACGAGQGTCGAV